MKIHQDAKDGNNVQTHKQAQIYSHIPILRNLLKPGLNKAINEIQAALNQVPEKKHQPHDKASVATAIMTLGEEGRIGGWMEVSSIALG